MQYVIMTITPVLSSVICTIIIELLYILCLSASSTAKKAGRRRISFRAQPGDSDNEQNGSEHDEEDDVETQGGAEPALSADNIEEDAHPSPSPPSSGKHHYSQLNSSVEVQAVWYYRTYPELAGKHVVIIVTVLLRAITGCSAAADCCPITTSVVMQFSCLNVDERPPSTEEAAQWWTID